MKHKEPVAECRHQWESLYEFRTQDGKKLIQQRCKKCQKTRYVEPEDGQTGKDSE